MDIVHLHLSIYFIRKIHASTNEDFKIKKFIVVTAVLVVNNNNDFFYFESTHTLKHVFCEYI